MFRAARYIAVFMLFFASGALAKGLGRVHVDPPKGYVDFCARGSVECRIHAQYIRNVTLSSELWKHLEDVNESVNTSVVPSSDQEVYGTHEYWTYPTTRGDCEDFVLEKKLRLSDMGLSPSSLLITIVRDENNTLHAVLTVATDHGDFILDNRRSQIRLWDKTYYQFVKRQSRLDPMVWESLERVPQADTREVAGF